MDIKLSVYEINTLTHLKNTSALERWKRHQHEVNFNVDDILIREVAELSSVGHFIWRLSCTATSSSLPAKYIVIFKDDNNICYIKKLSTNGKKTVGRIISLFELNLDTVRFRVDSSYQDALLLENDKNYDPSQQYKEEKAQRADIRKHNKTISLLDIEINIDNYLCDNIGRSIWLADNLTADNYTEYLIQKRNKPKRPHLCDTYTLIDLNGVEIKLRISEIQSLWIVFTQKPRSMKDSI